MSVRTDLALEAHEMCIKESGTSEKPEGIEAETREMDGVSITKIKITNKNGERTLQKPIGTYVTIEAPGIKYSTEVYESTCRIIAEQIQSMAEITDSVKTLVVGLGNKRITPDALGPEVVSRLVVTNHLKEHMTELFSDGLGSVCAVSPGVLGTTGIETAQIIKGIAEQIRPELIIAVDALASRSMDRISTTIQISDTGINPGSGVENNRSSLSEEALGVKVLAIGVPTVVDAATIASDSIDMVLEDINAPSIADSQKLSLIKAALSKNIGALMVTPKDIDLVIERAAKTVANGINLALHRGMTLEEIEGCVGA